MTVSAPTLAGYDEVQHVALTGWRGDILVVAVRFLGELWMRLDSEGVNQWSRLPLAELVQRPTALVLGDELLLAWGAAGKVRFARYDLLTRSWSVPPTDILDGDSPAMTSYKRTKVVLSFAVAGAHRRITSDDRGSSWLSSPPVDVLVDAGAGAITEVNVSNPNPQSGRVLWSETDTP